MDRSTRRSRRLVVHVSVLTISVSTTIVESCLPPSLSTSNSDARSAPRSRKRCSASAWSPRESWPRGSVSSSPRPTSRAANTTCSASCAEVTPKSLTAGEIGSRTIAREPDITRLVDRLDARGLVHRARSEQDRRVVEIAITGRGLELLRGLDLHSQRMPRELIGHVGPRKLRQLSKLLAELLDGMGTYP